MVARSYTMVASGFAAMDMNDSARVYMLNSLDWIDALDSMTQSELMQGVADMYQAAGERGEGRAISEGMGAETLLPLFPYLLLNSYTSITSTLLYT